MLDTTVDLLVLWKRDVEEIETDFLFFSLFSKKLPFCLRKASMSLSFSYVVSSPELPFIRDDVLFFLYIFIKLQLYDLKCFWIDLVFHEAAV